MLLAEAFIFVADKVSSDFPEHYRLAVVLKFNRLRKQNNRLFVQTWRLSPAEVTAVTVIDIMKELETRLHHGAI
jgi:hypothetical protein